MKIELTEEQIRQVCEGKKSEVDQTNKKYEFTGETKVVLGVTLRRIRATADFGFVSKGAVGGWIQSEKNLAQEGNAWVSGDAKVFGDDWSWGNDWSCGDARVFENARGFGDAKVRGGVIYGKE